jgi:hypothetical protein
MNSQVIYIASPYSHPDDMIREQNYIKVAEYAAKLISQGHVAISPIAYGHTLLPFVEMPSDWPFWSNFCISILNKCDKLIVYQMEGWDKSRGVAEEIEYAEKLGIPVEYIKPY